MSSFTFVRFSNLNTGNSDAIGIYSSTTAETLANMLPKEAWAEEDTTGNFVVATGLEEHEYVSGRFQLRQWAILFQMKHNKRPLILVFFDENR